MLVEVVGSVIGAVDDGSADVVTVVALVVLSWGDVVGSVTGAVDDASAGIVDDAS